MKLRLRLRGRAKGRVTMHLVQKQRQRVKRTEAEIIELPTEVIADTSDAASLIDDINTLCDSGNA